MATEFGANTMWAKNLTPSAVPAKLILDADTRWIRVSLKPADESSNWKITIRDTKERPLQTISSAQMAHDKAFWTNRLPSNAINIFLESEKPATTVRLVEYVAMSKEAKRPYYSIQGPKEAWIDLFDSKLEIVDTFHRRKGDAVGMFVGHSGSNLNGFKVWSCSGFLVAEKPKMLFVTNDHCGGPWSAEDRWTPGICETAVVDFSWDGDAVGREYACQKVVRDEINDLAVLELASRFDDVPPKPLTLRDAAMNEEPVFIIHHPAALPKQISMNCQAVTDAAAGVGTVKLERDFAHRCDTEGGSSGAPVFDEAGLVVGVHHIGFEKDATGSCDMFDKAIKVSRLIAFLRSNSDWTGYEVK